MTDCKMFMNTKYLFSNEFGHYSLTESLSLFILSIGVYIDKNFDVQTVKLDAKTILKMVDKIMAFGTKEDSKIL